MNSFLTRFSTTCPEADLQRAKEVLGDEEDISEIMWGSGAGFGNLASGVPRFSLPSVSDPSTFLRLHTDDHADPSCRIKIKHGTTTLAFRFQGGVIVAVDSRATAGSYVASGTVKKVIEINPYLLGTMAGGAADCQYWETYLVAAASKYLSNLVYSYKGMGLSMGTMICGWDKTGPAVFYVDSDGTRLKGDVFSVGSGSTFAYGVLDQGYRWDLTDEEAQELGRRSIYAAGHRDAFSGNTINLYHVKEDGWKFIGNYDVSEMHYNGPKNIPGGGYGYDLVKKQANMKRLLSKTFKVPQSTSAKPQPTVSTTSNPPVHTTGLHPKYVVPPIPHPCPHEHIAILVTTQGLVLRPRYPGQADAHTESQVRIGWGKAGKVEALSSDVEGANWNNGVVVYGIVGILELFSGLLCCAVLDVRHPVYSVKGVTPIPLVEDRARTVLDGLSSRNKVDPRLSMVPLELETPRASITDDGIPEGSNVGEERSPRVKFADEDQVRMLTPLHTQGFDLQDDGDASSASSSVASTPSSESSLNTDNVVKAITARLSFWNRLHKRTSGPPNAADIVLREEEGASEAAALDDEEPVTLESFLEEGEEPAEIIDSILATTAPTPSTAEEKHSELEQKILRECVREFTRGGMYFAYSFDITRSLQHKHDLVAKAKLQNSLLEDLNALDESKRLSPLGDKVDVLAEPSATLPLWRRVDRHFWWNEWLSKPFIDAGLHPYVLPIMQGFYQIASFSIPREPVVSEEGDFAFVDYILISRRSRDRAGLRYQRRGIDDDANVANFVETESIVRVEREGLSNVFSHVQIRGSIPLYWNQNGYGLKPAPQLSPDRTHAQNLDALRRHFARTTAAYGPHTIVNLAERHGKEAQVTNAYGNIVAELDSKDIRYKAYDFHAETKGMKYENISHLIVKLERIFESQGYFWISDNHVMSQQKGVFRVNCIDGLDRTNVVEESSAFARHVLNRQLGAVALLNPEDQRTETDIVFNDVWANNGDAISRAYAGTSALKGDFTRTGKRDLTGLLNDGVNSLARMYSSTFADWFSQAVIDFMLGTRTLTVFSEFLLKLQSTDPRDLIRISKIRADAIATCVSRLLPEGERLLSGWTLFAPEELNTRVGDKFEEKVLLLSAKALYVISYDYTLEKVKMYTRVPLGDIIGISKGSAIFIAWFSLFKLFPGVYILSPLEEASRDPLQNAGFVVSWRNSHQDTRVTSYSMRNSLDLSTPPPSPLIPTSPRLSRTGTRKGIAPLSRILSNAAAPVAGHETAFAAFKALPIDPARVRRETGSFIERADELAGAKTCRDAVNLIADTIRQACRDVGSVHGRLCDGCGRSEVRVPLSVMTAAKNTANI
ncbi:Proteasome subunit beta type-5 [Grifola frondosa]|uniref:Proteasome subunit beta type-5 n=1 Tax=Grifola frondosa TaxID=5627 RepID=A0A1C7LWR5_GRIFR|nr:Proteasome subunit beta type-5 [Grifola frondosa]